MSEEYEEFEQRDLFKQCRQRLTIKVIVLDETNNCRESRKVLWYEAMKEQEFTSFLARISELNQERRDTVGERIRILQYPMVCINPMMAVLFR